MVRSGSRRRRLVAGGGALAAVAIAATTAVQAPAALATVITVTSSPKPQLQIMTTNQIVDTTDGAALLTGVVKNVGNTNAADIVMHLDLFDGGGNLLESNDDNTTVASDLFELAPGEQTGFTTVISIPAGYDHFTVASISADEEPTPPNHNFTVAITGTADDGQGGSIISGTIRNNNAVTAHDVYVTFDFFYADGSPLYSDWTLTDSADDSIPAGGTETWSYDYIAPAYGSVVMVGEGDPVDAEPVEGVPPVSCNPCVPFKRVAGSTAVATSVAASKDEFADGAAGAVVLTRDDQFPDALAGGPLAAHVGGPLLMTGPKSLDAAAQAEIARVAPKGSTVYILGGPAAVSTSVDSALLALGYQPKRVYGADRYATAVAVAKEMGNPTTIFEATGLAFPDALAAGPAAITAGGAILLTDGDKPADVTTQYLATLGTTTRYALGGPAAAADPSAKAIVGSDRYDTAARVASTFFPSPIIVGLATGGSFTGALAAVADLGSKTAPLLLVTDAAPLPTPVASYLTATAGASVTSGLAFGGQADVADDVISAAQNALFAGAS